MNISIIGTGFMASVHAEVVLSQGHSIALIIGSSNKSAKEFANKFNIEHYSDNIEDIKTPDIDIVHICTPPTLHYTALKKCLEHNKHVLCEKPLGLKPFEAIELMEIANEKNLNVAINYNVRFHSHMNEIREVIDSEDFGDIFLLHGNYLQEFHVLPSEYSWRFNDELAGDMRAVTEIGSHLIDLVSYLTSLEIIEVSANFSYVQKERFLKDNIMYKDHVEGSHPVKVKTEDAAFIIMRFSNGSTGNFTLSEVSHGRSNHISFEITGTKKSIWWNSENPYQLHTASSQNGMQTKTNAFANGFSETIKALIIDFYTETLNLSSKESHTFPSLKDGYKNDIICNALLESSRSNGSWIKINYN